MDILFVDLYGGVTNVLWYDLMKENLVKRYMVRNPYLPFWKIILRKFHTKYRYGKHIYRIPYREIWYEEILNKVSDEGVIVFTSEALAECGRNFLEIIRRRKKNVKLVLLLLDSLQAHSIHLQGIRSDIFEFSWDLIMSFELSDCQQYGFIHSGMAYYSKLDIAQSKVKNDLYYVGAERGNDGRRLIIKEISKRILSYGGAVDFNMVTTKRLERLNPFYNHVKDEIKYRNHSISYEDVIKGVLNSNCILEVLQEGQEAQTLRYFEAVCYNKKLLTNNQNISQLPFYDERYMRCFSSVEDIDIEWLKRREPIDYGYKGEFSPIHLLEKIKQNLAI